MYLLVYHAIVCSIYQYAVLPSYVNVHLRDKEKHNMTKKEQKQIIQKVQAIKGLRQQKEEFNTLVFP